MVIGQGKLVLNKKKRDLVWIKREGFYGKSSEALEQVAQRGGGVLGDIQGQAGWGSEQPDVAVDVPVHCREVGLVNL